MKSYRARAEIQQLALMGLRSSRHSEACCALGACDGVSHQCFSVLFFFFFCFCRRHDTFVGVMTHLSRHDTFVRVRTHFFRVMTHFSLCVYEERGAS